MQLQHHRRYAAVRGAQQVARLPEGLFRLVSRIREIQNGHENVGEKAAGKKKQKQKHFNSFVFVYEISCHRMRRLILISPLFAVSPAAMQQSAD